MQSEIKSTNKPSKPKVVFLDWNKTLSNSLFWEQLADKNHPFHHLEKEIIDWLFVKNRDVIKMWMRGDYTSEEVCAKISQDLGVDFQLIFSELAKSCLSMEYCDPDVPKLVNKIRSNGVKVVIATDNMDTFRRFTVSAMRLQESYDDILVSSELGALKDDYENGESLFFSEYMKKSGLDYSEVLLLDDSVDKMPICKDIGLPAVNINSPKHLIDELNKLLN
jgi:FMN phosphatase YigB (HAD superfamily)